MHSPSYQQSAHCPASDADDWRPRARTMAAGIRRRVLAHVIAHNGGYLSQACSSAEIFAALYSRLLHLGPLNSPLMPPAFTGVPQQTANHASGAVFHGERGPDRDRFFMSPAQYALILYAALVEAERMDPQGLAQFNQDGATVEMIGAEHSPGMEAMTGSLGQGLSQAAGVAFARQRKGETGRVWTLLSDGELQCGQTWEALQTMAFLKLDAMRVIIDANGQQCDGRVQTVMPIEPLAERLSAFGAQVAEVDGHDLDALAEAALSPCDGKPLVIVARTDPTRDLPLLEARAPKLHYIRFSDDAERQRYAQILAQWEAAS
ncbi:MAG: transketolase [Vampirovibrionales bacterium]|nr:transketolase [Vampirovibrionales bacterium]